MNMNAKNMSDYESHEENEDIILKLKDSDKLLKKDKSRNLDNPIVAKLDPVAENSKLFLLILGGKRTKIQKRKSDYDDYLDKASSQKTGKRMRSIGIYLF